LFEDTTNLFTGKHPDFMANNLKHHDYEHTLQAKVCLMHLLEGRHLAKTAPRFNARQFELAIASALLQDTTLGDLLQQAMEQLSLSARAYDCILKVARTIADLAGADKIECPHLLEATQYRSLDRKVFY
tara:strand:- start:972 stop:1358 length:387 start_codon:yes stop_codon:yes gene_type:complete